MGIGIWSMHFLGMLAFRLPIRMGYDPVITLISALIAIAFSAFALWIVCQNTLSRRRLVIGSLVMGAGVCGMHFTGMAAMRISPPSGHAMTMGGASALSFLLPLIIGVSLTTFVLTATIALSPNEEEMTAEAELMRRIDSLRGQPPAEPAPRPAAPPEPLSSGP